MDKWLLKIEKIDNGYVLEGRFGNSEIYTKRIIEEKENPLSENIEELKAMQNLMWEIEEYFGVYSSKHNEYNLEVKIINQNTGKELECQI